MGSRNDTGLKVEDALVLEVLAATASEWQPGLRIGRKAGVSAGLVYPPLARLERLGAIASKWEKGDSGQKPRRVYRITGAGQRIAGEAMERPRDRPRLRFPGLGFPEGQMA